MHGTLVTRGWTAILVLSLALPAVAAAQVEASGSMKLSLSGGGFLGPETANMSNLFGLSYFAGSGLELGGDIMVTLSRTSVAEGESELNADGFAFGRLAYNFISESLTVPFISVGAGAPLNSDQDLLLVNVGAGFKRFISERVSFDVMANFQGQKITDAVTEESVFEWSDGLSLFYGLSIYLGN